MLYPENVLKESNEAMKQILIDRANEHKFEREKAERLASS